MIGQYTFLLLAIITFYLYGTQTFHLPIYLSMYLSISVCIYLSRWGDANVVNNYRDSPRDREMSKSLMNVKEKSKEGSETPLMKV